MDPTLSWTILLVVVAVRAYRSGYEHGRRTGLATRRPPDPTPPIVIRVADRPTASVEPPAPTAERRWVRIGGRTISVEASSLTDL
jgi:hypothetical protein